MPQTKKLTVEQDFKKLAEAYRISPSTLANAVQGKTFKDLPMPPRSR
jgi:hypothetical protein